MNPPETLKDLIEYLATHPWVRAHMPGAGSERRYFVEYRPGGIIFRRPNGAVAYTPIACGKTAILFDPTGFFIEKFGITLRFDYLSF